MILSRSYSRQDVIRWLGAREVQKGAPYIRDVSRMTIGSNHISARVQGTMRAPYQVEIAFSADRSGRPLIDGSCSCPVGYECKHVAAVLLAGLENRDSTPQINPAVLSWIESFRLALTEPEKKKTKTAQPAERLFYVLWHAPHANACFISMVKSRPGPDGGPGARSAEWSNVERALLQPPRFVDQEDLAILRLLWMQRGANSIYSDFPLAGRHEEELLRLLLASGRFHYQGKPVQPWPRNTALVALAEGKPRPATLEWRTTTGGEMVPTVVASATDEVAHLQGGLYYLDVAGGLIGRLELPYPHELVARLLTLPPLREVDVPLVSAALQDLAPTLPVPSPARLRVVECAPRPILTLATSAPVWIGGFRGYRYGNTRLDHARLSFRYGEFTVEASDTSEFRTSPEGEVVRVRRERKSEQQALKRLGELGLAKPPAHVMPANSFPAGGYLLESEADWPAFVAQAVPRLRAEGWEIDIPKDFRHLVLEVTSWDADLSEDGSGWFSLDMGIVVEGRKLPLAPLLYELFQHDPRWLDPAGLRSMPDNELVVLALSDGGRVSVSAARLKPLARTLVDMFDTRPEGPLRLSRLDAPRLDELAGADGWRVSGADKVRALARQLEHGAGVAAVAPPAGLALQLRPYQLEGLAWLQHLGKHELGGILADDMGLGKTAQTLAHLLLEKEAGRLDRPTLVVLPTSLIFNWKREAERFAPDLKVLSLHGKDRAERFPLIPAHDVALTTYPLLWRDEEEIARHDYHLLILDEAQTVKNAASRAALVVRRIHARHRLCLTGTPLENHLGELWAQFDFLLPGFLGDSRQFTRTWRNPVEKQGDRLRAELLSRRVKPFILRRRKEDVARELPPKTVIVRNVELEGGQRDLYETVRSAMDQKVRDEIAAKGFARSHIVILDALLKLRQVCCDPRLLKIDSAKGVKERAKLDLLMGMLPELVDEGRRVLVFSQFTSMLALIEKELVRARLGYVLLTGDTVDREGVIRRFQDGEAPIFLISLKAGGVGLNLTAADTVIHFDPWWNPAVENQATDRAHRIGQTKKVFVYKLVVAGSIEEKILALQERKADLAAGILSEDASGLTKFNESDIAALLAPLPEETRRR